MKTKDVDLIFPRRFKHVLAFNDGRLIGFRKKPTEVPGGFMIGYGRRYIYRGIRLIGNNWSEV